MNREIVELIERAGAILYANAGSLLVITIVFLVVTLIFRWMHGLYTRFANAGQERMGLYLVGAMQSWFFLFIFTQSVWWDVGAGTASIAQAQSRLWLHAPFWPSAAIVWAAGMAVALSIIAFAISEIEDALKIQPTRLRILMHPRTTGETVVWSLVVSPTAGFCEEVLFRGVLIFALAEMTRDLWLSIALSSVLFGIVHAPQGIIAVLGITLMGFILALGVVYTGSLWPSIIAHTLYDMAVPFLSRLDDLPDVPASTTSGRSHD